MKRWVPFGLLLLLGGCKVVKNDIPPEQIAMQSPFREQQAAEFFEQGKAYEESGNAYVAAKNYQIVCRQFLETQAAPKSFHAWSRILASQKKYDSAFQKLAFVLKNYPDYPLYDVAVQEGFTIACHLMKKYEQAKRSSKILSFFKDPKQAIEGFQYIVSHSPRSSYAPQALLYTAELQQLDREPAKAVETLEQLIDRYPKSEWIPSAYLLQSEIYLSMVNSAANDQGITQRAISSCEEFLLLFGQREDLSKEIAIAKARLQKAQNLYAKSRLLFGEFFYLRRHYPEGALPFYQEVRLFAPESSAAQLANRRIESINNGTRIPTNWADHLWGPVIYKPMEISE